jgi:hypothetical protein
MLMMMMIFMSNVSNIRILNGNEAKITETKTITAMKASRTTIRMRRSQRQEDTEETKVVELQQTKLAAAIRPDSGPG